MGVASGGGALREHGHGANRTRTSAPSAAWPMGRDGAALPLCAGQAQDVGEQPGTQRTGPQNSASRHFGVKFKSEREVHDTKISNVKTGQTRSLNFGSGSEAVPVQGPVASAPPRPRLGDTGHGQTWNQDFPDPGFFAGSCAPPGRGAGAACPAQAGALAPRSGVDPDRLPPQGPTVTPRRHLPS